ncbi:hypothetical protein Trydic_g3754, partial [Trypoxylus dichotomus]
QYGKYEVNIPTFWQSKSSNESYDRPPSSPGDPGYVQYTAKRWGQQQYQTKTPRQSPTESEQPRRSNNPFCEFAFFVTKWIRK